MGWRTAGPSSVGPFYIWKQWLLISGPCVLVKVSSLLNKQNLIAHGKPNCMFLGSGPWSISIPDPFHLVTLPSLDSIRDPSIQLVEGKIKWKIVQGRILWTRTESLLTPPTWGHPVPRVHLTPWRHSTPGWVTKSGCVWRRGSRRGESWVSGHKWHHGITVTGWVLTRNRKPHKRAEMGLLFWWL